MSRAIMHQALDALKYHTEHTYPFHLTNVAIEALQKALAQSDSKEPVAWAVGRKVATCDEVFAEIWRRGGEEVTPLYTAPPRNPWVGLTDDEIHKIINDCTPDQAEQEELNDFARAVRFAETKLKDKNT